MKQVSYIEFKPPVSMTPRWLYYLIQWLLSMVLAIIIAIGINFIPYFRGYIIIPLISMCLVVTINIIAQVFSYVRIYSNGDVQIRNVYSYQKFNAKDVENIEIKTYSRFVNNFIRVDIKLRSGKRINNYLNDYGYFIKELLKHNPNIKTPELPII